MPKQAEDIGDFLATTFDSISNRIAGGRRQPLGRRAFEMPEVKTELGGGLGLNESMYKLWDGRPDEAGHGHEMSTQEQMEVGYHLNENRKGSLAWGGHANGLIPEESLVEIGGGQMLEATAARAWQIMVAAAAREGVDLGLIDTYRSYDDQVRVRRERGHLVATATPGTSNHGWGRAVDVSKGPGRRWIQQNGARFGWIWPEWAQRPGKSYEDWHFEYRGTAPVRNR